MTKEEIKQRNESKEFLKDLQYYLFQNKRSPKIDKLSVLLDNDEKRIDQLEKENAELQEKLKHRNCVDCSNHGINIKLIKAKEIIRKLINACCSYGATGRVTAEAEQFLNSEVEK